MIWGEGHFRQRAQQGRRPWAGDEPGELELLLGGCVAAGGNGGPDHRPAVILPQVWQKPLLEEECVCLCWGAGNLISILERSLSLAIIQ